MMNDHQENLIVDFNNDDDYILAVTVTAVFAGLRPTLDLLLHVHSLPGERPPPPHHHHRHHHHHHHRLICLCVCVFALQISTVPVVLVLPSTYLGTRY